MKMGCQKNVWERPFATIGAAFTIIAAACFVAMISSGCADNAEIQAETSQTGADAIADSDVQAYADNILDIAFLDFPSFSKPDDIPIDYLLSFGILAALKSDKEYESEEIDGAYYTIIPASDVESQIMRFFAYTLDIGHKDCIATYDSASASYRIASTGITEETYSLIRSTRLSEGTVSVAIECYNASEYAQYLEGELDKKPDIVKEYAIKLEFVGGVPKFLSCSSLSY